MFGAGEQNETFINTFKKGLAMSVRNNARMRLFMTIAVFSHLLLGGDLLAQNSRELKNVKPKLFDIHTNDIRGNRIAVHRPLKRIVLDPEYAGEWIVAGDVDGDGQAEIVSANNFNKDDSHYTSSVVVHRLDGSVLWRWGNPSEGRAGLHHDVGCQIYDWDGDGKNEVVVAARKVLVELDGATGKEKRRLPLPNKYASDCIVFANLSGGKHASDILVKSLY